MTTALGIIALVFMVGLCLFFIVWGLAFLAWAIQTAIEDWRMRWKP
jgi:hypothetical protein